MPKCKLASFISHSTRKLPSNLNFDLHSLCGMRINTGLSILQILINFQDIFARKYYFHIRGWRMKLTFGLLVFSYMLCAYFLQTGLHVYCFLPFSDTGHLFCSLFSLRVYSEASMLELFKDT